MDGMDGDPCSDLPAGLDLGWLDLSPLDITVQMVDSIQKARAEEWNSVARASSPDGNPFVTWEFLNALEESGSAHRRTGWVPRHLLATDVLSSEVIGCVPLYLKTHSYGEYVFDHDWARAHLAFSPTGYYPKLQCCVPFTPVTGARFLTRGSPEQRRRAGAGLRRALQTIVAKTGISSAHVTFLPRCEWLALGQHNFLLRTGVQYHWANKGYNSFDDFLASLRQSRRKRIRQERNKVVKAGITVQRLRGGEIQTHHWDAFFQFYLNTVDDKWGQAYLTRDFFRLLGRDMCDACVLVLALDASGAPVAGALHLIGANCLYGRNWGCSRKVDSLHFELCYYQAIEAAIEMKLDGVEAGAQGEHKIARGYLPTLTYSAHYIPDSGFRDVISQALAQERQQVIYTTAVLTVDESPYKCGAAAHLASQGISIREREEDEEDEAGTTWESEFGLEIGDEDDDEEEDRSEEDLDLL